jgi:hypothetical protein
MRVNGRISGYSRFCFRVSTYPLQAQDQQQLSTCSTRSVQVCGPWPQKLQCTGMVTECFECLGLGIGLLASFMVRLVGCAAVFHDPGCVLGRRLAGRLHPA